MKMTDENKMKSLEKNTQTLIEIRNIIAYSKYQLTVLLPNGIGV